MSLIEIKDRVYKGLRIIFNTVHYFIKMPVNYLFIIYW